MDLLLFEVLLILISLLAVFCFTSALPDDNNGSVRTDSACKETRLCTRLFSCLSQTDKQVFPLFPAFVLLRKLQLLSVIEWPIFDSRLSAGSGVI